MKINQIEITKENIQDLLNEQVELFNAIKEVPLMDLEDGQVLMFYDVNRAMVLSTSRVRAIGEVYGKVQKLETDAKRFYEGAKADATLKAGLITNRDTYPDAALRKAFADKQSENDRKVWESIKSIVECIHIERQDLWDYRKKLETISWNLKSEAKLGG